VSQDCRDPSAELAESRDQHENPPPVPVDNQRERDNSKPDSHENCTDAALKRGGLSVLSAPVIVRIGWGRQLSCQRLWYQAEVGATHAAEFRVVTILSCTIGAVHIESRSLPEVSQGSQLRSPDLQ